MSLPYEDFTATVPQELMTRTGAPANVKASGIPFWGDAPGSWETVRIAGIPLPGICTIDGKVRRRHDKKHTAGINGAALTYLGDDQAEFTVIVIMWTPDHLASYANIINVFREKLLGEKEVADLTAKSKDPIAALTSLQTSRTKTLNARPYSKFPMVPLDVSHPVLKLHKIKSAHVLEYGFPKPKGEASNGIYEAAIQFIEYVPGTKGTVMTAPKALDARATDFDAKINRKPSVANTRVVSLPNEPASFAP